MAQLKELLIHEGILKTRLDKCIENGKKTALVKRTQGFYENKSNELKKIWESYANTDLQIMQCLQTNPSEDETGYLTTDHFGTTEAKYSDYMSELLEGLRKCTVVNTSTTSADVSETVPNAVTQQDTTLPRIALPRFNGDYDAWRSFHDLFVSLVHNNIRITPVQKLHYLKTCLIGDAERVLRHTPITDQEYEPAWNKLKDRYENTRILVNHQLKTLINQAKLNTESTKGFKSLIDVTEECLQQLQSLEVDTSSWDVLLIYILVQKLPLETLKSWEEEQGSTKELPTFKKFKTFLNTRLKVLESISDALGSKHLYSKPRTNEKTSTYHAIKQRGCPACRGKHFLPKCPKYKEMSIQTRRKFIQSKARCLNCLSSNHTLPQCTSKYSCFRCNKRHHTSLHEDDNKSQAMSTSRQTQSEPTEAKPGQKKDRQGHTSHSAAELTTTQAFVTNQNRQALLSTALVLARSKNGLSSILRCLIDPGSQSSFITEAACQKLDAVCTPTSMDITGLGTSIAASSRKKTTLQLQACNSDSAIVEETFLVLKRITDPLPKHKILKDYQHLDGLLLADSTFWKPGKIDALLGASIYTRILQEGIRRGPNTAPVAINTIFGWILLGPTTDVANRDTLSLPLMTDYDLHTQLQKFWEIEECSSNPILKQEEEECQVLFQRSHKRLDNGQYQVMLPFINNQAPALGESRPQAMRRFLALQKQFKRNPGMAKDYVKCLNEYKELGHMEMINPIRYDEAHYYIPHHAVFKDSSTTNLRVVFDASCKTTNGRSLNDHLLKGPILQPKLSAILLNWRKHKIAMTADIEKMYRMILIHPSQRQFQRIIWQHPITKEPQDFQLNTVTFGTTSAPYLAIRTLQQLAEDERERWPLAAKATLKSFYVDDLLTEPVPKILLMLKTCKQNY